MSLRFYLDEDIDIALAEALKRRSVSAITTQQAGNSSHSDHRQLIYAKEQDRIIITHNIRDFITKTFWEEVVPIVALSFVNNRR